MSADTFLWVAKFKDWYRTCFWQAPDNLSPEFAAEYIPEYFSWPPISTLEEAIADAHDLEQEIMEDMEEMWCPHINEYWLLKFDFTDYDIPYERLPNSNIWD